MGDGLPRVGRYKLRRLLGRGATGTVYEAYDDRDHSLVALKTIEQGNTASAENLYRLKHEFRALADLTHPNLVRFGELSCENDQWFFTMESVHGTDFIAHVRPDGVLDEARLRSALPQLVSALSAVHQAGRVHRDVKPSNVIVAEQGRVVLLDFGLALAVRRAPDSTLGSLEGTPEFMAPEQITDEEVGAPADWYALGGVLFMALTGRTPFEGPVMSMLDAKVGRAPPRPSELVPNVAPDLDGLCARLLCVDPGERASEAEIRSALSMAASSLEEAPAIEPDRFVGREAELGELHAALARVREGACARLVVQGEPGIGKSVLVSRFLAAAGSEAIVLSGRCYEQETMPFKGVDTIIDALTEHILMLPDREVEVLLGGGVRYLAAVFPILFRVPQIDAASAGVRRVESPAALREQAFGELERLFARLTARAPVVLYLDDLQWADRDSIALLRRLLAPEHASHCLFVATMRSDVELLPELELLLTGAGRIALRGLSPEESIALCELFHESARPEPAARAELLEEAKGHPLFLAELFRVARAHPAQEHRQTRLQDVLWERIASRDPLERRFLSLVALAGAPISYRVVAEAAELDVGECQTRLGSLRAAQLVRVSRRGEERHVEPYHDRVREAILQHGMDAEERTRQHWKLGWALLRDTHAEARSGRIFAIVQHLNAGAALIASRAEACELAALNLGAAREAQLATAYQRAVEYARIGQERLGSAGFRDAYETARDLCRERMVAEYMAGTVPEARATFEAARAHLMDGDRTDLYVAWIELEANHGRFQEAIDEGRAHLAELRLPLPTRPGVLSLLWRYLATRRAQRGRSIDALLTAERASDARREAALKVLMALAPPAFWVDSNLVGWISLRLPELSLRFGMSEASAYGFVSYGVVLGGAFGRYHDAAAFGRLAIALNERFANDKLTAKLHQLHGTFMSSWDRPFAEARRLLDVAYEAARKHGDPTYEAYSACCLSFIALLEGAELSKQEETSSWAREVCVRRQDRNMAGSVEAHARYARVMRGGTGAAPEAWRGAAIDDSFRSLAGDPATSPGAYYAYFSGSAELAYFWADAPSAVALLSAAMRHEQANFGNPGGVDFCLLRALISARAHDGAAWLERLRLRRAVAQCVRKLKIWAEVCPVNFAAHHALALAEQARLTSSAAHAEACFARAVVVARQHGSVKREALALELSAAFAGQRGQVEREAALRAEATGAYRRWGADARAAALAAGPSPLSSPRAV